MTKKPKYKPVPKQPGLFQHCSSGRYQARKCIEGTQYKTTFETIYDARVWLATFDGKTSAVRSHSTSTLKEVWAEMQERHFPLLAPSTREIWTRRYGLLKELEGLRMEEITSSVITSWVEKQAAYFKSDAYQNLTRGKAKRCNLDNELNLFTTIFNWYKKSEKFEREAVQLPNPVRFTHKRQGFISPKPIKDKAITLEAALRFFQCLRPLYRDLALLQFFTASRIGEAAGLQWSRIDFENRTIVIMETCQWNMSSKTFVQLNPFPKNKEPRTVYMTDEILEVLKRRLAFRQPGNDFVFHVEGSPLNYCTIQLHYREAQRISGIPYRGTHILRHGMAKLARKVGGGLDAVVAMTGHKDFKLADHYSKLDSEFQKETSLKIMDHIKREMNSETPSETPDNVVSIAKFARSK
jgi:integrase